MFRGFEVGETECVSAFRAAHGLYAEEAVRADGAEGAVLEDKLRECEADDQPCDREGGRRDNDGGGECQDADQEDQEGFCDVVARNGSHIESNCQIDDDPGAQGVAPAKIGGAGSVGHCLVVATEYQPSRNDEDDDRAEDCERYCCCPCKDIRAD